jgi:hypothetical protein
LGKGRCGRESVLFQGLADKLHHAIFRDEPVTDCFMCGKRVSPGKHLLFDTPGGPQLPVHPDCLNAKSTLQVAFNYHLKVTELADRSRREMKPHLRRGVVKVRG